MHVLGRAWRNIVLALALATFALPLATAVPGATPASAQTNPQAVAPSSIAIGGGSCAAFTSANCYVTANPGLAFNIVGTTHTVRFTCGAAVGPAPAGAPINTGAPAPTDLAGGTANAAAPPAGPGLVPGCYNVSASVTDETTGTAATFTYARCGNNATILTGSTVNCAQYESPICPLGAKTVAGNPYCSNPDPNALSLNSSAAQMAVSINPGAPHSYLITFTGYTPLLRACGTVIATGGRGTCTAVGGPAAGTTPACPAGFTYVPGPFTVSESIFTPPFEATVTAPDGVCRFQVAAEKKYVEITSLTLTGNGPCAAGAGASTLFFAEGLKTFFGAPCVVTATAVGVVILKSGVDCAAEPPANGTPASAAVAAGFPPGSTYQCIGGTLQVRIPNIGANTLNSGPIPIEVTVNNGGPTPGSTLPTPSLGGLCTGVPGTVLETFTGSTFTICPIAAGTGSVRACTTGAAIDTQPVVCSNTLTFRFVLPPAKRVVPYVRWAGEKQVLTKCFGGAGLFGGSLVEFTLEGAGAQAQAALIPASLNGQPGSFGGSEPVAAPSQNTVITLTDVDGCASVIVYAATEGVVNVDAAIYSTAPTVFGTAPLLNEHAFEIFFLKFDHIDLENLNPNNFPTYTANPLSQLGFSTSFFPGVAALPGPTCPTANPYLVVSGVCLPFISVTTPTGGYQLPPPPGTTPPGPNGYSVPLCVFDLVRAMVHGYFEYPGDPSGRPATTVGITGAPTNAAGSYTLPAGRWVLPEDWPVLATFAGFNSAGNPNDTAASSIYAWDLNTGWAFNPTGELPVACAGPQPAGPYLGYGPITDLTAFTQTNVSEGPCYGEDITMKNAANGTFYSTAPDPPNCDGLFPGLTVGIGPFDPTQACTNPFPLSFSPSGSSVLVGGPSFGVAPVSTNSTYLPNGTLNEWDAPMPPAQVQFSINAGPGFLTEVNKTGLYQVPLVATGVTPAQCAAINPAFSSFTQTGTIGSTAFQSGSGAFLPGSTTNPVGVSTSTAVGECQISSVYPDPFYAEAIPASPLIPPITNDGGYLWNTWGFNGGMVLGPTTAPAFIPGLAPTTNIPGAPCGETLANGGEGFTFVAGAAQNSVGSCFVGSGGTPEQQVTLAECNALGGTWTQVFPQGSFGPGSAATGTCEIPPAPASAPGGINLTNFGPGCPAFAGLQPIPQAPNPPGTYSGQVEIADGTGFVPGLTVTVVDLRTGKVIATGLKVTGVAPGPNGGTVLTFDTSTVPAGMCVSVYGAAFISEQIAVTVPGSNSALAALTAGTGVSVTTPFAGGFLSTPSAPSSIFLINGNTLFLSGAAALANALGNCALLTMTNGQFQTCLASVFLPAGALIVANPNVGVAPPLNGDELFGGQGPYPFWQWVPNPSINSTSQRVATVYSDNHGESMVALQTGVTSQLAPVNGACPSGYVLTSNGANCLLNLKKLATTSPTTNFQNVAAALGLTAPGCITTNAAGGTVPAATATATATATAVSTSVVGGTGPTDGQICINNLGGIEFGPSATLGISTIQAIADYPYNRLHPAISSGNINKIWTSSFAKTVTVSPPLSGPAGTTSYTVTITGVDICGNPIVGEQVSVFALSSVAGAVILAPLGQGTANGTSSATVNLNGAGVARLSLEVLNQSLGNSGLVIKAVFPLENVERFVTVVAGNAGTGTTQQIYPPGYNMVGGPPGSNFGSAEALFTYDPAAGTYGAAGSTNISSAAPTCTGYWAYFASATTVSLAVTSKAGDTVTCNLQAGWNLVGNPFGSNANIQSGVTAYHYNPSSQAYDLVTQIPLGGAVFIYEAAATTVTLTAT